MASKTATLSLLVATALGVACGKSNKSQYGAGGDTGAAAAGGMASSAGTAAAAANSTAASRTTPAGSTATAGAQALTDPNIVYILDQADTAEIARGVLAETKGTSTDVKNFGKLMAGEHHALNMEAQALAKKLNVTPQAPAGDQSEAQAKQEMDSLKAMPKGAAWDKAYIDYEIPYHKDVIDVANKALAATQNAQLKALITKAGPLLKHHLDLAEQIQKKLGA